MDLLDANIGKEEKEIFFDNLRKFISSAEESQRDVLQVFDDSALGDITVWDATRDTVSIDLTGTSVTTSIADTLGRSKQHKFFFRMTMSIAALVVEMRSLAEEAHDVIIPPIATFADYGDDEEEEEQPEVTQQRSDDDGRVKKEVSDAANAAAARSDERAMKGLANLMSHLSDTWQWVERVKKVFAVVFRNLASLYSPQRLRDNYEPYTKTHFPLLWNTLVDLSGALVAVEECLAQNEVIQQGIRVYRKMLTQIGKHRKTMFTEEDYPELSFHSEQFGKLLQKIENDLLDGAIIDRIAAQNFDSQDPPINVASNGMFFQEFNRMFHMMQVTVDEHLCTPREGDGRRKYLGLLALHVIHFRLFKERVSSSDFVTQHKNTTAALFEMQRKVPAVAVSGKTQVLPGQWIARKMPSVIRLVAKNAQTEAMACVQTDCARAAGSFLGRLNFFTTMTTVWVAQMQSSYATNRKHSRQVLTTLGQLIQRGVVFAQDIHRTTKHLLIIHEAADVALNRPLVDGIAHAMQLLVMIRNAFHGKSSMIGSLFHLLLQTHSYNMQKGLYALYQRLNDVVQTQGESVTDQLSAIKEALHLLNSPLSPQNLICLDIVLGIAFQRDDSKFLGKDYEEIYATFTALHRLCNYQKLLYAATNCDFVYWQRESLYPLFFKRIIDQPTERAASLPLLIAAMHDARVVILSSRHLPKATKALDRYVSFVRHQLQRIVVNPLCEAVETELRLTTHGSVLGQPFRKLLLGAAALASNTASSGTTTSGKRDYSKLTMLASFRFFNERMHIGSMVEDYLDRQFYNLNALMSNDWKTYEEMRNTAQLRFGLHIAEGRLPGSIVDQGLDVLVITENILVFIANYTYNLNEQLFIQRPNVTESKQLHTLHIRHIANSIRTHGTGIMNTAVNYVYKALLKKLAIVSQFLYDDHVKSRLLKEQKNFAQHKEEYQSQYPMKRAEKYCSDIRKLGLTDDGRSYLDQFRQLVAEIGNALGYMRLVRSGGLRAVADAAVFIPDLGAIPHLEKKVNPRAVREDDEDGEGGADMFSNLLDEGADEEDEEGEVKAAESTIESSRVVDRVVANMSKKLKQGSDYFRMLHEALAKKLKDPEKYGHLKLISMIIPSITISHVENMVQQKEQLCKKNKDGLFTDDGFALGAVFLLSLVGGMEEFDSLHWFEGVRSYYQEKLSEMSRSIASRSKEESEKKKGPVIVKDKYGAEYIEGGDSDLKTMNLTFSMAQYAATEYALLEQTITSCRVFFSYKIQEDEPEEEEDE